MNFKLTVAQSKGANIAKKFGDNSLPVDLSAIAGRHNILVQAKPGIEGVSGMLLRHGNSFGIMYSSHITSEGFRRFSIAHELGHYFLEGHLDHILPDKGSIHKSSAGFASSDSYELEADYFASGLLMPDNLILPIIRKAAPGFSTIKKIAESCKTSLVSSAIRYASLSEDATAIILSEGRSVIFAFLSQSMKSLPEISWPAKNSLVPADSLTARFNENKDLVLRGSFNEDEIDVEVWLGGNKSFQVKEEVKGLGSYGKALTVLTCSNSIEEMLNSEENDLLDSWEPKF